MNNAKLKQTHKHLTLVFTGVVFAIVMLVGISFLAANYVSENTNQKSDMYTQISMISSGMQEGETFFEKYAKQKMI
jgi:predicted tellurium resistance membrane protein TerC